MESKTTDSAKEMSTCNDVILQENCKARRRLRKKLRRKRFRQKEAKERDETNAYTSNEEAEDDEHSTSKTHRSDLVKLGWTLAFRQARCVNSRSLKEGLASFGPIAPYPEALTVSWQTANDSYVTEVQDRCNGTQVESHTSRWPAGWDVDLETNESQASATIICDRQADDSFLLANEPPETTSTQVEQELRPERAKTCSFFARTGVCKFSERCTFSHVEPAAPRRTLLIRNMLSETEADADAASLVSQLHTEMLRFGTVLRVLACSNEAAHLQGNVYCEFADEFAALRAFDELVRQPRALGGFALRSRCKLVRIASWRESLCAVNRLVPNSRGLLTSTSTATGDAFSGCSRGAACNYLHLRPQMYLHASLLHAAADAGTLTRASVTPSPQHAT